MRLFATLLAAASLAGSAAGAQTITQPAPPAYLAQDPAPDAAHPPGMSYVQIPSHGVMMNGVLYTASGAGPHPTLLFLHGFPGNEQNLDLAQAARRAGFDVLTLHYRGSWGSPGAFSFAHAVEDADAAIAFLRTPAAVAKYAIDPKRIFVAGHSMGGFMALNAAAHDTGVAGIVMISAWDIGANAAAAADPAKRADLARGEFDEDVIPLAGTSSAALIDEIASHPKGWRFADFAPAVASRPVLLVTAAYDDSQPDSLTLKAALASAGDRDATSVHIATDHSYSGRRIALITTVIDWLVAHAGAPPR